jgi:hypothetical protein
MELYLILKANLKEERMSTQIYILNSSHDKLKWHDKLILPHFRNNFEKTHKLRNLIFFIKNSKVL